MSTVLQNSKHIWQVLYYWLLQITNRYCRNNATSAQASHGVVSDTLLCSAWTQRRQKL